MGETIRLYEVTGDGARRVEVGGDVGDVHAALEDRELGIYSAFRTYPPRAPREGMGEPPRRRFFGLEAHLDRADQSMRLSGWPDRLDRPGLRRALQAAAEDAGAAFAEDPTGSDGAPLDLVVRFDVLDPAECRGEGLEGRLWISVSRLRPMDPVVLTQGVRVEVAEGLERRQPLIKRAEFARRRRPYPLHEPGAYEHLLLDPEGRLLEATSANVFVRLENRLWTCGAGMLEGITRRALLECCEGLGIAVEFGRLDLEELYRADEVLLSSSTQGVVPVVCVLAEPIGFGRPGPWTQALTGALGRRIEAFAEPAWPVSGVDEALATTG